MRFLAALAVTLPSLLSAETITFESDEEIMIVRGVQMLSHANFELLGNKDGQIQCVAIDANGKPLAVSTGYAEIGSIMFTDMQTSDIAKVACRYR